MTSSEAIKVIARYTGMFESAWVNFFLDKKFKELNVLKICKKLKTDKNRETYEIITGTFWANEFNKLLPIHFKSLEALK